jgi:phospholipid transport system substrate-binding protein
MRFDDARTTTRQRLPHEMTERTREPGGQAVGAASLNREWPALAASPDRERAIGGRGEAAAPRAARIRRDSGTSSRRGSVPAHAVAGVALVVALVGLAAGVISAAPSPMAQIERSIDAVLRVLKEPVSAAAGSSAERRAAVIAIADDIFDWTEMTRRSLARHWSTLDARQRAEFVGLFRELLAHSYMSRLEEYSGEPIRYVSERVDGDYASVGTTITTTRGTVVPVVYRMLRSADRWRIYDVRIEGVSLVSNYRTQFNSIIQTSSFAELIARLRDKVRDLDASS